MKLKFIYLFVNLYLFSFIYFKIFYFNHNIHDTSTKSLDKYIEYSQ